MKKNFIVVAAGLGLAQLALPATKALAQTRDTTTRDLNTVVVTATRSPKTLKEIGRAVTVISAEQIKQSQGKTLPQLLNLVPGLMFSGVTNAPGQATEVYLRGASAGNTLILIDGFPVNDAQSIAGNYDLNSIAMDQIDHIEILKGSGSTLYGSDAVAGVINIITRHAQGKGVKAAVQLNGGSYNTFRESADINGMVNQTGIAVNVSNTDSRGFSAAAPPSGNTLPFDNDGFYQRSISANISQYVSSAFTLKGNLQLSRNTGDLDFDAFTDDKDDTYKRTFMFAGLGAAWTLPAGSLLVNASQNNVWSDYNNLPSDNFNTASASQNLGRVSNIEAVFNYTFDKNWSITSGADYKYYNTIQHSAYRTDGYNPPPSSVYGSSNITSVYTSLFFKAGIFHIETGARYNHHNTYGDNFTYTINPSVYVFDRLKVFGTIASAYKAPTLYQLYAAPYGNSALKPEKTTASYEAGFEWEVIKKVLTFNTAFYQRKIKDAITTDSKFVYQNINRQNDKGFESELGFKKDKLTASAYMTYVVGKQTNAAGVEVNNLYRRPKNTYGANASYQVLPTFVVGLDYKYMGDRQDQDFNSPPYPAIVDLKHYNLLNAHLQWQATKKLMLFTDLNNILNKTYIEWYGYSTRKINFMSGLKYQFN
ncbi:vitamin B12 transporter [Mucilaginibacter yixingensis]|uniref:Vitamin B12 transporter n=1 Tax=Mucilaginibacter yixingensis TaxID=1295612 RepID=A0A2T5JA02_9SPHI|nr:TonB-dependent receptor [Mucilaginibacter yixingensis]PTQ96864.1 vitamin B12 transporter [Mucilaginibacter yixingensis]